jgi:hypothetical protein
MPASGGLEMALDFTVVITVRQRFGDNDQEDVGLETEAPFVGKEKEFEFRCPNVDSRQQAILLFQCMGANLQQSLEINDQQIFGGIPAAFEVATLPNQIVSRAQWNGNVMLIHPGVLREDNVLRIRAGELGDDNLDDFIIDNLVVVFKTKPGPGPVGQPQGNLSVS